MTAQELQAILTNAFHPKHILVRDQSHAHQGHAGNSGGGHFSVELTSKVFEGMSTLQSHRLVYQALGMPRADIHALTLKLGALSD